VSHLYLKRFPRKELATLPTALQPLPRLSAYLGDKVEIWIKRDDNTGLALGGNKARKLEFLVADALAKGCDTLITAGGPQSNHCRMTAAAAAKMGMECHLVFNSRQFEATQGNLLLDRLLNAKTHFCPGVEDISREMSKLAEDLAASGRRPYVIPIGGSTAIGALGYVAAVRELLFQADQQGVEFSAFVSASGSGGTQAGLLAGTLLHHLPNEVLGISVSRPANLLGPQVEAILQDIYRLLELEVPQKAPVLVDDSFVGRGYGLPTEQSTEALEVLANTEGVIIDPVYTAKAVAGLLHNVRSGYWPVGSRVLFWHTGGSPALFADQVFWEVEK
jgi:D-cysteine desulfhydrase family pyridoxal phosphate-dependent enzyme